MKPLILLSFLIIFSGCVSNVSNDSGYPTDYKVGAIYRLKQPVFADKSDLTILGTYSGLALYLPNHFEMPSTIQEYRDAPQNWVSIAGVVPPGTLIRITKVELEKNPTLGKMVWIRGRLLDLPWAKKDAQLAFISKRVPSPDVSLLGDLPMVDTDILELVSNDSLDIVNKR